MAAQFAAAEFQHVPLRVSPTPGVFYSSIPLSPWACISSHAPGFHTPSTTQCPVSRLRLLIDFDEIDKRVSLFVSITPDGPPLPPQPITNPSLLVPSHSLQPANCKKNLYSTFLPVLLMLEELTTINNSFALQTRFKLLGTYFFFSCGGL